MVKLLEILMPLILAIFLWLVLPYLAYRLIKAKIIKGKQKRIQKKYGTNVADRIQIEKEYSAYVEGRSNKPIIQINGKIYNPSRYKEDLKARMGEW